MTLLPKTSLPTGYDTDGKPVKLGDTDSSGYTVGYIAPDGLAAESLIEAEVARAAGVFDDRYRLYRVGLGTRPNPDAILAEFVNPENHRAVRAGMLQDALTAARMRSGLVEAREVGFSFDFSFPEGVDPNASFGPSDGAG